MMVIAIDGPAGSGKSTVARALAAATGLPYLDTGAMYRAVTYAMLRDGVSPAESARIDALLASSTIEVGSDRVSVDGEDVTVVIRGPEVTSTVSAVAALPAVRTDLVARQRAWVHDHGGGVLEGRDIGTVVFPDATLKVFLTARPEVRAARRAGESDRTDVAAVAAEIERRDTLDSQRAHSPLTVAGDAVTVDTSDLDVPEIVDLIRSALP